MLMEWWEKANKAESGKIAYSWFIFPYNMLKSVKYEDQTL